MDGLIHIHDGNWQQHVVDPVIDGERKARGLVPRAYTTHPVGCYDSSRAIDIPLIPQSEWPGLIRQLTESKSRLSDIRETGMFGQKIPSRDQNGRGYCWFHSGTSAVLLCRARDHQPYADLSAYAGACIIKNYRDEGGWGAQGVDWMVENGVPDSKYWPQRSVSRSNDTPEMRANARLHRIAEGWWDLNQAQYDRNLTFAQVITCLLSRIPVVLDFNWWSHSVCGADAIDGASQRNLTRGDSGKILTLEEFDLIWGMNDPVMAGTGILIWNSWADSWSNAGMGVLSGQKAVPDGSVAVRGTVAAAA